MEQKQKLEPKSIYDYTKILEEIPDYDEVRGIFLACQIPEWEMVKEEVTNEVIARVCKKNCVNALTMIYEAKYFASFLSFK